MTDRIKECVWGRHCPPSKCPEDPLNPVRTKGTIPDWIQGTLFRTGPGIMKYGDDEFVHAFDGNCLMHAIQIKNGKATYQFKPLNSNTYKQNSVANRITVSELGTVAAPDPCLSLLGRFMTRFRATLAQGSDTTDNCVVNCALHGDELFAYTEAHTVHRVSTETLETIGDGVNMTKFVAINQATAHPHTDEHNNILNMGNSFGRRPFYNIVKFPPPVGSIGDPEYRTSQEQAEIIAKIPARDPMRPAYYHSFAMSENYFVFVEQSMFWNTWKVMGSKFTDLPATEFIDWDPNLPSKFHVIDRKTGEIYPITFTSRALAIFHHVNAYEKDNQLVVDFCCGDGTLYKNFYLEMLRNNSAKIPESYMTRFVLPLLDLKTVNTSDNLVSLAGCDCKAFKVDDTTVSIEEERIVDHMMEMPRINYGFNGREYRFGYGITPIVTNGRFFGLIKVDTQTKTYKLWNEEGTFMCEPVFIARPGGVAEDDGVILSLLLPVHDDKKCALVVLNAVDMTEVGRAEFEVEGVATVTLHGLFKKAKD